MCPLLYIKYLIRAIVELNYLKYIISYSQHVMLFGKCTAHYYNVGNKLAKSYNIHLVTQGRTDEKGSD